MRHTPIVLAAVLMTSACTPMMYGARPYYGRQPAPRVEAAAPVVGRWDNIMMLAPGTPLRVLTMDGTVTDGSMLAVTAKGLRVSTGESEVTLAVQDVARIDRGSSGDGAAANGARGAAVGAAFVGWLGLLGGRMPPPRVFLAGALAGAGMGVAQADMRPGPSTLYLAPAIVHTSPAGVIRHDGPK